MSTCPQHCKYIIKNRTTISRGNDIRSFLLRESILATISSIGFKTLYDLLLLGIITKPSVFSRRMYSAVVNNKAATNQKMISIAFLFSIIISKVHGIYNSTEGEEKGSQSCKIQHWSAVEEYEGVTQNRHPVNSVTIV